MLKLITLEDVIRDAIQSREEIKTNIGRLLQIPSALYYNRQLSQQKQSLQRTQSALQSQQKSLQIGIPIHSVLTKARKKLQSLRHSIQVRRESMHTGLQMQAQAQIQLVEARESLLERKSSQKQVDVSLAAQRRRICLDLQNIYPITSVDDETLRFMIRGVHLPSAGQYEGAPEEEIATALGWTAHLVYLLSLYLCVPLRYPVQPVGGRSLIKDPVSIMVGSRTYFSELWL